jgi:hypothetical protein
MSTTTQHQSSISHASVSTNISTSTTNKKNTTLTYLEFYSGVGGWSFALKEACKNVNQWLLLKKDGDDDNDGDNDSKPTGTSTSTSTSGTNNISFSTKCLGAYDHSDLCYKVFHHNFPEMKNPLLLSSCVSSSVDAVADKKNVECDNNNRCDNNDNDNSTCMSINKSTGTKPKRPKKKKQKMTKSQFEKPISIEKLTKKQIELIKADIWMMSPPCQPHTRQHTNQKEDVDDPRSKSFLHLCDLISTMEVESLPKIILLENVIGFENVSVLMLMFIFIL